MKFYKKAFLALSILLTSCAHTRANSPSTTQWLDSYQSSGSFCFDAYIVNSASNGCTEWNTRGVNGAVEIRCLNKADGDESLWNSSTFVLAPPSVAQTIAAFQPICGDSHTVFGVINLQ